MADINSAFTTYNGISLDDIVGLFQGTDDPTSGAGETAPIGSLFLRTNGELYQKTGAADTAWTQLGAGGSSTPSVESRHNGAVTQTITTTFSTIFFDTAFRTDGMVTYNLGTFTVNETGQYRIIADLSADVTANTRTTSEWKITTNSGDVAGSFGYAYHRNLASGEATCTIRADIALTAGDTFQIEGHTLAGANITTLAGGCRIFIEQG